MGALRCNRGSSQVTLPPMSDNATPLILLTRPQAQAERFAEMCRAEFGQVAEILIAPMQEIADTGTLPKIAPGTSLIFGSENGVLAYIRQGGPTGLRAYCVGDRTAKAAELAGLLALSANGAVTDLEAMILERHEGGALLHLHGEHVSGDLTGAMRRHGLPSTEHVLYTQRALPLSDVALAALASSARVIAPLFSPRSARLLADAAPDMRNTTLPCISPAARLALPDTLQAHAPVSDAPTAIGMLIAVARQLCP